MLHFQVTAPFSTQVMLSSLGESIGTRGTVWLHCCHLSDPDPLKGVGEG